MNTSIRQTKLRKNAMSYLSIALITLAGVLILTPSDKQASLPDSKPKQHPSHDQLSQITSPSSNLETVKENTQNNSDQPYQGEPDKPDFRLVQLSRDTYESLSSLGPLPDSLRHNDIPPLHITSDGHLLTDRTAQLFIEHFITAISDESFEMIKARMQEYFSMALSEPAQSEANELLEKYLEYRSAHDQFISRQDIAMSGNTISALEETLAKRRELRREILGDKVAQSMFSDSEKYETYVLEAMKLEKDTSLSPEQKQQKLSAYEQDLPTHIKNRIERQRKDQALQQKVAELKKQGADESEIYALRAAERSEQYAKTWQYMEERSPQWQAKVARFEQQVDTIENSMVMTEEEKQAQIESLRNQIFDETEKLKLAWQSLNGD